MRLFCLLFFCLRVLLKLNMSLLYVLCSILSIKILLCLVRKGVAPSILSRILSDGVSCRLFLRLKKLKLFTIKTINPLLWIMLPQVWCLQQKSVYMSGSLWPHLTSELSHFSIIHIICLSYYHWKTGMELISTDRNGYCLCQ